MLSKQLQWEPVDETWSGMTHPPAIPTFRAKVPGGWLVCVSVPYAGIHGGAVFLPDPEHKWPVATRSLEKKPA